MSANNRKFVLLSTDFAAPCVLDFAEPVLVTVTHSRENSSLAENFRQLLQAGFRFQNTSAVGARCALSALAMAGEAAHPDFPDEDQLFALLESQRYRDHVRGHELFPVIGAELFDKSYLSESQIRLLLELVAADLEDDFGLAILHASHGTTGEVSLYTLGATKGLVLYIYNNGCEGMGAHWSGFCHDSVALGSGRDQACKVDRSYHSTSKSTATNGKAKSHKRRRRGSRPKASRAWGRASEKRLDEPISNRNTLQLWFLAHIQMLGTLALVAISLVLDGRYSKAISDPDRSTNLGQPAERESEEGNHRTDDAQSKSKKRVYEQDAKPLIREDLS